MYAVIPLDTQKKNKRTCIKEEEKVESKREPREWVAQTLRQPFLILLTYFVEAGATAERGGGKCSAAGHGKHTRLMLAKLVQYLVNI